MSTAESPKDMLYQTKTILKISFWKYYPYHHFFTSIKNRLRPCMLTNHFASDVSNEVAHND